MNNIKLEEIWKSRMELRNEAKSLSNKRKFDEEESLKLYLEYKDVTKMENLTTFSSKPSIDTLIKTYGNDTFEKLNFHDYCDACIISAENLRIKNIKISKEIRDIISKSDDIWIKAVTKCYNNITIKWTYDEEKNDFSCELENGEIYLP